MSGTVVGEYEIEKPLGSGGMGAVYGAIHVRLGRRVAIKVIAPALSADVGAVERFEQESIALARLSHPNIVNVVNVGVLPGDGRSYFVMEWLAGTSLQTRIERGRPDLDDAMDIVDQIARGLDAAHAAGVIHRDLKPDNVWLQQVGIEPRPIAKLLDFGLAKLGQHRRTEHTATNVMFGTPGFMSPEQCQSARDVGPPTDVYALGCLMFELFTGRLPFTYDNYPELIVAHQTEEPPRVRELDPAIDPRIDALIFAMLAKDPSRRPTLAIVRSEIAGSRRRLALDHEPSLTSSAQPNPRTADPARPKRGPRRAIVAAGSAVLLLVFVLAAKHALKTGGDDSVGHSVAPLTDASSALPSDSISSTAPETSVETPADASGPVMKPAPRQAPPSAKIVRKQLDAGIEVRDAAAVGVTVEDGGAISGGSGSKPPVSVPAQATQRPTSSSERPRIDRNQTFNPFEKQPASR